MDGELRIEGYSFLRRDRVNYDKKQGGGILIYVRETLPFSVRNDLLSDNIESLWFEILRPKSKALVIGCCYRPPDANFDKFIEIFKNSPNRINSTGFVCVLGDFNIDFDSTRDRSMKQNFKSCLLSNDLVQIVKKPTSVTESSRL